MPSRFTWNPQLAWLAGSLILAGCQHAGAPPGSGAGRSSFTFVEAPPLGPKKTEVRLAEEKDPVDTLVMATPVEPLVRPAYPKAALAGAAGSALVGIRIVVDVDGRVAEVGPSLVCFSTPGPFAAEFRAAVEEAVTQWKFVPAKRQHLEPARADDGSIYWRAAANEKVPATFDVAFSFSADGEVTSQAAK